MSGFRAAAGIFIARAPFAPFLAGCNEPDSAIASVGNPASEPDVSVATVKLNKLVLTPLGR